MNVSLTDELERYVDETLKTGGYRSASEVVREALRLHRQRSSYLESLRARVAVGLDQALRGELLDGEATMAELKADLDPTEP